MVTNTPATPDSRVLAIASHVVSGYVGNATTTFVLQLLGHETASLNTVQFSNHSGYRRKTGECTPPRVIGELWDGMKQNGLHTNFSSLLTGYVPGAEELEQVGRIAADIKSQGDCFWLLDPVMGDMGRLYVSASVVPVYKNLAALADCIVPNQFEAELLSGVHIDSLATLGTAIDVLHAKYGVPHVVVTSVTFSNGEDKMVCAGSTLTPETRRARKFVCDVDIVEGFFSGTGDLFAALLLARLRDQAEEAGLLETRGWMSGEDVTEVEELPLAKAVGLVLASMGGVLEKTRCERERRLEGVDLEALGEKELIVTKARASELRLVQSQQEILVPGVAVGARPLE